MEDIMKLSLVTKKCLTGLLLLSLVVSGSVYSMENPKRVESKKEQKPLLHQIYYQSGNTKIKLGFGDIVSQKFSHENNAQSAIVNAANNRLDDGEGVAGAIYKAAGKEELSKIFANRDNFPLKESEYYGGNNVLLDVGEAVVTEAFELNRKGSVTHIIHALGPNVNRRGIQAIEKASLLEKTYNNILDCAASNNIKFLAMIPISTAFFGYEAKSAAIIACLTISKYLKKNPNMFDEIRLVMYSPSVTLKHWKQEEFDVDNWVAPAWDHNGDTPGIQSYQGYKRLLPHLLKKSADEIGSILQDVKDLYDKNNGNLSDEQIENIYKKIEGKADEVPKQVAIQSKNFESKGLDTPKITEHNGSVERKVEQKTQISVFSRYKRQFMIGGSLMAATAVLVFGWLWWNKK